MSTAIEPLTETGPCVVCNTPVDIEIARNGGVVQTDVHGYSGLTDDGDKFVCRDHFCPTCGASHLTEAAFDTCQFNGPTVYNVLPPRELDALLARAQERKRTAIAQIVDDARVSGATVHVFDGKHGASGITWAEVREIAAGGEPR